MCQTSEPTRKQSTITQSTQAIKPQIAIEWSAVESPLKQLFLECVHFVVFSRNISYVHSFFNEYKREDTFQRNFWNLCLELFVKFQNIFNWKNQNITIISRIS